MVDHPGIWQEAPHAPRCEPLVATNVRLIQPGTREAAMAYQAAIAWRAARRERWFRALALCTGGMAQVVLTVLAARTATVLAIQTARETWTAVAPAVPAMLGAAVLALLVWLATRR